MAFQQTPGQRKAGLGILVGGVWGSILWILEWTGNLQTIKALYDGRGEIVKTFLSSLLSLWFGPIVILGCLCIYALLYLKMRREWKQHFYTNESIQGSLSQVSNAALQKQTLHTAQLIRHFLHQIQKEETQQAVASRLTSAHTIGETQEKILRQQISEKLTNAQHLEAKFRQKFKTDAILLRDELRSRLSIDAWGGKKSAPDYYYEQPLGVPTIEAIADDLEFLAKKLAI